MYRQNDGKILHGMLSDIPAERLYISSDRREEEMSELRKDCQGRADNRSGIHKG